MRNNLPAIVLLALVLGFIPVRLSAQATNAPATTPSTNAPAAAAPGVVALADVNTTVVEDSNKLQEIKVGVVGDQTVADVDRSLAEAGKQIDGRKQEDDAMLAGTPALPVLRSAEEVWRMMGETLRQPKDALTSRISQLDGDDAQLQAMDQKWKATRAAVKASSAHSDVLANIDTVVSTIAQVRQGVDALRAQILSAQSKVVGQDSRIQAELGAIKKAQGNAVTALFVRDSAPLWALGAASGIQPAVPPVAGQPNPAAAASVLAPEFTQLRTYIAEKFPASLLHLIIFNGLALFLFWVRGQVAARTKDDPAVQHAAQVFQVPIAMAAVLALLLSPWFYPLAPRLFHAGLGAAALIPAVIILRRLIEPSLFPILYAMVLSYFVDQLRYVLAAQPLLARGVFLVEMLAAIFFFVWLVRSGRLSRIGHDLIKKLVRAYASSAVVIFLLAALANILGYTHLSYLAGSAMLGSGYFAVILYAAVRIADGLILSALKIRPFSLLGMVQRHYLTIAGNISTFVRWLAFIWWAWVTLELFSIRSVVQDRFWFILDYTIPYGTQHLSLGPLLLLVVTIWAAILLSRLIRFVLHEEVFPHLRLGPGVPYAISNMVHYTVLVLGTLFALNGVGIRLSDYSVLIGALGVGLGFGLQNIINNFVSGIILLFERPIKVGDVIQVDTAMGTVESIGIRASVIRITNGSEIIMPNGNLISSQVTNWTFSDRRRVIDIPVTVAAKSEPQKVMNVLIETAKANTLVLKDPPPQVLFTNFTGGNLNFELRAWTNSTETWGQIRSDLSLAISAALERESIAVA